VSLFTELNGIRGFIDSNCNSRVAAVTEDNTYRRNAMHCVRTAERLRDPGERAKLFEIARAYLELARRVAEREDRGSARRVGEYEPRQLEDA
jgi:hypothetical protein